MDFLSNLMHGSSNVNEQHILHIRLSYDTICQINNELQHVSPLQPTPQTTTTDLTFTAIEHNSKTPETSTAPTEGSDLAGLHYKVLNPSMHYPQQVDQNVTALHCMWDTHPFHCKPVGIPTAYNPDTGTYRTIGCFCSLQCAAAQNMSDVRISIDTRYERHGLMETMAGQTLSLAPDRECLVRFGGNTSIERFRSSTAVSERVLYPPMVPHRVYHVFRPMQKTGAGENCSSTVSGEDNMAWTEMLRPHKKKHSKRGLGRFIEVHD